jgi:succinoglycan biosynthesis protein ExoA
MSCYRREVWVKLAGYDESLLSNEDFDFDYRASSARFSVFSLPHPTYFPLARPDLQALVSQRWRYGFWKAAVLRKHPKSLHLRQLLPPLVLISLPFMSVFPWLYVPGIILYLAAVTSVIHKDRASLGLNRPHLWFQAIVFGFLAAATIHFVWSAGLIWGLMFPRVLVKEREKV